MLPFRTSLPVCACIQLHLPTELLNNCVHLMHIKPPLIILQIIGAPCKYHRRLIDYIIRYNSFSISLSLGGLSLIKEYIKELQIYHNLSLKKN